METLIRSGANIHAVDSNGFQPLHTGKSVFKYKFDADAIMFNLFNQNMS